MKLKSLDIFFRAKKTKMKSHVGRILRKIEAMKVKESFNILN